MADPEQIYVHLVHATASVGNIKVVGDRHAVVVLVREVSLELAERAALDALRRNFWELPDLIKAAPLNPQLGTSKTMEDAISDAAVHGVSLIVYNDTIPKH